MEYLGISLDNKYVFTSKGFYICEGRGKFVPYGTKMLPHLFEAARKNMRLKYRKGLISLSEYKTQPKKVLYEFFKIVDPKSTKKVLLEYDRRTRKNLITENDDKIIIDEKISEAWDTTQVLMELFGYSLSDLGNDLSSAYNYASDKVGQARDWVADKAKKVVTAVGDGLSWVGKKIMQGLDYVAQQIIIPIIKQGVIPLIRWIRRNLNTYLGIIVDVILSVLPTVVVMKVIWALIVILDIYEIATGDYDPKDPERKQMPFVFLTIDIISLIFTAAAAKGISVPLKVVARKKAAALGPGVLKNLLTKLLNSMPKLKGLLMQAKQFLTKLFGNMPIITKLFGFVDNIVTKFTAWIQTLVGATAKKATVGKVVGAGLVGMGLAEFMKESTLKRGDKGDKVRACQEGILNLANIPIARLKVPGLVFTKKDVDSSFGPTTENAVKMIQQKWNKSDPSLQVTGKIDPKTAFGLGVKLDPTKAERFIGEKNMEEFGKAMIKYNNWIASYKLKK